MSDEQILSWAALTNYAYCAISPTCVIRHGRERWERRLPMLTEDERAALITKINRQQARLQRELAAQCEDNVPSQGIQRLAKEDSTPASCQGRTGRRTSNVRKKVNNEQEETCS